MSRLVIVYHRQPYDEIAGPEGVEFREHKSPNGIIPSLRGACRSLDNPEDATWVAWSRCSADESGVALGKISVPTPEGPLLVQRVGLTEEQVKSFYYVTSKAALWPILHSFPERFDYDAAEWETFREVNRIFADGVCACASEGAVVWVHDYNLWLVPGMVRARRPDLKIAFFLHTPFPPPDIFGILPWRSEILESLLACDRVGFHIPRYAQNFMSCARGLSGARVTSRVQVAEWMAQVGSVLHEPQMVDEMEFRGRKIAIDSIPLGINTPLFRRIRELAATQKKVQRVRQELGVDCVLFSVGRVDYTKGTSEMLAAYERLLQRRPELHGRIKLCVTSVAPANDIDVYEDVQREIEQRVGAINGQYSTLSWSPVLLFTQPIGLEDLVAWYRAADVCWITPLRDGLNLVAKEFVLSKGGEGGVLVLSDFAGCVVEMDEAIHCNPYSRRSMDAAIDQALTLPEDEIKKRAREMYKRIGRNSIALWTTEMLGRLGLRHAKA